MDSNSTASATSTAATGVKEDEDRCVLSDSAGLETATIFKPTAKLPGLVSAAAKVIQEELEKKEENIDFSFVGFPVHDIPQCIALVDGIINEFWTSYHSKIFYQTGDDNLSAPYDCNDTNFNWKTRIMILREGFQDLSNFGILVFLPLYQEGEATLEIKKRVKKRESYPVKVPWKSGTVIFLGGQYDIRIWGPGCLAMLHMAWSRFRLGEQAQGERPLIMDNDIPVRALPRSQARSSDSK